MSDKKTQQTKKPASGGAKSAKGTGPKKRPERGEGALRITRVYTRTGDAGTTRLVGNQEVGKASPRIEAYGTVDELAVWLGEAREQVDRFLRELSAPTTGGFKPPKSHKDLEKDFRLLDKHLEYLQNLLFVVGGELATLRADQWEGMPLVKAADVKYVERLIDAYNENLPPLKEFILAGGGPVSLALHHARVVCRRAERSISRLGDTEDIAGHVLPLLNRFSDLFFVLARWVVHRQVASGARPDLTETTWNRNLKPPRLPK